MEIKVLLNLQLKIIKYLYTHPNGNNNIGSKLSKEIGATYSCCCINYKILKDKGLIYYEKVDGRSRRLFLTDKGKEIVNLYLKIEELI